MSKPILPRHTDQSKYRLYASSLYTRHHGNMAAGPRFWGPEGRLVKPDSQQDRRAQPMVHQIRVEGWTSGTRKVKPVCIYMRQETMWFWDGPYANSLHLAPDRWPHQHLIAQFLQAGCSSWRATNSVKGVQLPMKRECASRIWHQTQLRPRRRAEKTRKKSAKFSASSVADVTSWAAKSISSTRPECGQQPRRQDTPENNENNNSATRIKTLWRLYWRNNIHVSNLFARIATPSGD